MWTRATARAGALVTSVALATCMAAACGGGDDDAGDADAGAEAADAAAPDAVGSTCVDLEARYGDLGSVTGVAVLRPVDELVPDGAKYLSLEISLNQDAEPDVLFIELWDGDAPFGAGFAPGGYTLSGDQADLIQCGACVFIAANRVAGQPLDFHMASSGMLTLDTIDASPTTGRVAGSLSGLNLRQVTVDQSGQTTVPSGCRPTLDALAFDFTVAAASN